MYRPPNSDTRIFNEHVGSVLELLKTENKLCYILGDYDNILNYDSHNETSNFVDLLFSYSLIPLINQLELLRLLQHLSIMYLRITS